MDINVTRDNLESLRDEVAGVSAREQVVVSGESGMFSHEIINVLNQCGLWLYDTFDSGDGCVVRATRVIPMNPGSPSHCGIAGAWQGG